MHHISIITSNSHFCHHQYHHLLLVMVISSTSLYYISLLSYIQIYFSVNWNTNMKNKGHHHLLLVISIQHCHHQWPMFRWCLMLQQCSSFMLDRPQTSFFVSWNFLHRCHQRVAEVNICRRSPLLFGPNPVLFFRHLQAPWGPIAEHYKSWWTLKSPEWSNEANLKDILGGGRMQLKSIVTRCYSNCAILKHFKRLLSI